MAEGTRVALVSGGSRGIGRACVARLVADGFDVAFSYRSDAEAARLLVKELDGARVSATQVDVTDAAAVTAWVADVERDFGPIHAVVTSAGVTADGGFATMSDERWDDVLRTNLDGTFHVCRAATFKMMKRKCGSIVTLSSVSGVHGNPGQANYSAAKAGLLGFTKAVAQESASRGITCNVIAPGYISTEMVQAVPKEILDTKILPFIPVGRLGTAEEVARCVTFLAADDAGFITGACLDANGGQYMA
jgi:NAD(P)-dependent dehydrogenase (short-subunit alcohol dehydrogenase family)